MLNTPYVYSEEDFYYIGQIDFTFDNEFSYNNYKASTIDAIVVLGTIIMIYFIIWKCLCYYVKHRFYQDLQREIVKVDQEVQMKEGQLPLGK